VPQLPVEIWAAWSGRNSSSSGEWKWCTAPHLDQGASRGFCIHGAGRGQSPDRRSGLGGGSSRRAGGGGAGGGVAPVRSAISVVTHDPNVAKERVSSCSGAFANRAARSRHQPGISAAASSSIQGESPKPILKMHRPIRTLAHILLTSNLPRRRAHTTLFIPRRSNLLTFSSARHGWAVAARTEHPSITHTCPAFRSLTCILPGSSIEFVASQAATGS